MPKLDGKIALVTGGTTGIGAAIAKRFQTEGATVIITGSNPKTLEAARTELTGIEVMASDAGDIHATKTLVDAVVAKHGRIDVLVVNAGVAQFAPAEMVDEAFFDKHYDINVKGPYFLIKNTIPVMPDGGAIILIASNAGSKGFAGVSVYGSTKAALRSFGRNFAAELAPRRIRVNTISPGPIETPIFGKTDMPADQLAGMKTMFTEMVPLKRMGQADEIGTVAVFFASEDSSFVTGAELYVDGGMTNI